ncbi:MAG TPA: hypothetical protein VL049_13675 [Candidatus Dormibacteraeota bacterium]|nr:hypothetical protein [Candidatus Dormibacteraeota bacterium]
MKRTVILALGALALAATTASAQGDYNCYKAKDLKQPQFVATTFNVTDEFGTQTGMVAKKPFLYCASVDSPGTVLSCYKVKSPGFAADSNRTVTDGLGMVPVKVAVKKKSFVYCSAGTGAP